jgi:phosphoesterase, MJ0936 family
MILILGSTLCIMLTIVSDTHSRDGHRLTSRTRVAVESAALVAHAGDFVRNSVLREFEALAEKFIGVSGNNDDTEICAQLPSKAQFEYAGVKFGMTHTCRGGPTAEALFGRQQGVDVVITGHSHVPSIDSAGEITLINPGSHAQPRGNRQAHVEIDNSSESDSLQCRLVTVDGDIFERSVLTANKD